MKNSILIFIVCLVVTACSSLKKYEVGQIATPKGEILVWLYDETPNHKKSFVQLAKAGYWDSLTFNRVIPNFVAQAGCPDTPEGFNDPEYLLEPEFNEKLTHIRMEPLVRVGMGIRINFRHVANSILCRTSKGEHRLDGDYTVYGKVIKGHGCSRCNGQCTHG